MSNDFHLLLKNIEKITNDYSIFWGEEENSLSFLKEMLLRNENVWDRKNMKGHLTAVSILLNKSSEKVLLVDHLFIKKKLAPGGHCDPGELPLQSAIRELHEEVGILCNNPHPWHMNHPFPIDIDIHMVPKREKKNEEAHYHIDFRYIFQLKENTDFTLQVAEISNANLYPVHELKKEYPRVYDRLISQNLVV